MAREQLTLVWDIKGIRVIKPGGVALCATISEAAELPDVPDDDAMRHVKALATALSALQSQHARVALELTPR